MFNKLEETKKRYEFLTDEIVKPEVIANQNEWKKLVKERADIEEIVNKYAEYKEAEKLSQPIVTPSTKASEGHDINVTLDYMKKDLGEDLGSKIEKAAQGDANAIEELREALGKDIFEKYSIEIKNKENMHFIKDGFIDLTFENIFCKDGYLFYDQEWRFENIPIEFILYRAINNLYNYNWKELQQKIAKEKILSEFKIIDFVPYFEQLENKIQEEILNQKAIQEQTNKMKSYYKTIEEFQKDIAQKEQKILEMQEEYKILDSDNKKTIIEKEYIEKQYRDLLHEYETSRGWKVIKGIRKILGRK